MTTYKPTALRNTCILTTPSPVINEAFQYAKDNIARCMRYYTHGWGMSNAPHNYTIVVGRDTGWMGIGADYVAPWFAPAALAVFRDRQNPNGQIVEYVDLESDERADYGLNVADNTPHYIWGVWHHWQQYDDEVFHQAFLPSVKAAADYLVSEIQENGLLDAVPNPNHPLGSISGWRNIIAETTIAGEVTEINALTAMALRYAAQFTNDARYLQAAQRITDAINAQLWVEDGANSHYALTRYNGVLNPQLTGDNVFPVLCGVAAPDRAKPVLERLMQPDFWSERGMLTVPKGDPLYHPHKDYGLVGGSWANLTLWYAVAVAPHDPDFAVKALEMVARPVVEAKKADYAAKYNVTHTEFAEYFDSETGVNHGMKLSPWVAPTFVWAVMEGLLGLRWDQGSEPQFTPHFPLDWDEVRVERVPYAKGTLDITLQK